ncbi:MAG: hypothetical protein HKN43_00310 [Rhodothermales bacterium]|nr:hypothetical protein [Rhodothermales bacterium]
MYASSRKKRSNVDILHRIDWVAWENLIRTNGLTIDRPTGSSHPVHENIVYPIDYGYINETMASDGEEVDVFVGCSETGLVGAIATTDHRKGDREIKFIHDCNQQEIYLINGFINFDRSLMEGVLILRKPFSEL